jgi:hypothetical protein
VRRTASTTSFPIRIPSARRDRPSDHSLAIHLSLRVHRHPRADLTEHGVPVRPVNGRWHYDVLDRTHGRPHREFSARTSNFDYAAVHGTRCDTWDDGGPSCERGAHSRGVYGVRVRDE